MLNPKQLLKTKDEHRRGFRQAIKGKKRIDNHVHDTSLCMGSDYAIQGLPAAAGYHYVTGETGSAGVMSQASLAAFYQMDSKAQLAKILDLLQGDGRLAISTAFRGLYRIAGALDLQTDRPFAEVLREWDSKYGTMTAEDYRSMVFDRSCVSSMISTQSIFQPGEAAKYNDPAVMKNWNGKRYFMATRVDEALRKPELVAKVANIVGRFGDVTGDFRSDSTHVAMRGMIQYFRDIFEGVSSMKYYSASMGAEDRFYDANGNPANTRFAHTMRQTMLPLCRQDKTPMFLMPYVTRGVNPTAENSGDCVANGPIDDLKRFISENHDVRFIVTTLHPSMDYDLCFLSRACPNVRIIGFWWGVLNSNEVRRQIQQRFEMIGHNWTGLNSDARITDQILYKFDDFWDDLEFVLCEIILPKMVAAGAPITVESIAATVDAIMDTAALLQWPA